MKSADVDLENMFLCAYDSMADCRVKKKTQQKVACIHIRDALRSMNIYRQNNT